jgi:hypothetical protein
MSWPVCPRSSRRCWPGAADPDRRAADFVPIAPRPAWRRATSRSLGRTGGGASRGFHRLLPVPARRGARLERRGAQPGRRGGGHGSWRNWRACFRRPDDPADRRYHGDDPRHLAAGIGATRRPLRLGDGAGGGNRVSAARLSDPVSDGGTVTPADIAKVEKAQRDTPLFMVFGWQDSSRPRARALGYSDARRNPHPRRTGRRYRRAPPPVSCFEIWPPLAVQEEIWADGGIGAARLPSWRRAEGPKTTLFGRINDRPAGTAFIAVHGEERDAPCAGSGTLRPPSRPRTPHGARGAAWAAGQGARISRSSSHAQTTRAAALRFLGTETCGKLSLSSEMKANRAP